MIFFTGQRASGLWHEKLLLMAECWIRGETTALLTSMYIRIENKEEYMALEVL